MKVLRREIRPKISAVTKNRSVFHQSVSENDALAGHDVGTCEQGQSFGVIYKLRNGRLIGIGVVREDTHDEKADNQDDAACGTGLGAGSASLKPSACSHDNSSFVPSGETIVTVRKVLKSDGCCLLSARRPFGIIFTTLARNYGRVIYLRR